MTRPATAYLALDLKGADGAPVAVEAAVARASIAVRVGDHVHLVSRPTLSLEEARVLRDSLCRLDLEDRDAAG